MNYSTAVTLINDKIIFVSVHYEVDGITPAKRTIYKTLDTSIKKGDLVVVPTQTRHGMTVSKVDEVDVDIDLDDKEEVKWIVQRVNQVEYESILEEEQKWIDIIKSSEKKRRKEQLRKSVMEHVGEDEVNGLKIADMSKSDDVDFDELAED